MAYSKYHDEWKNYPDESTPLEAAALDHIEDGIETVAAEADGLDVRVTDLESAPAPVLDHGALTGLADDDHPQYALDTRVDATDADLTAEAATRAAADTALDTRVDALEAIDPLTQAEGDVRYWQLTTDLATQVELDAKVSDTVYGSGWNGDTTVAPSKNAVYDKIEALSGTYGALEDLHIGQLVDSGEEVISRLLCNQIGVGTLPNGVMRFTYFTARKTETVNNLVTISGTAAGATPTLCRMGVYSVDSAGDLTLVASCANDTTLWSAANTAYSRATTAPWSKVAGTRYAFAALCVTGASAPAVVSTDAVGTAMATRWRTTAPTLTAVRTGQTDLPASITAAALSDNGAAIYAEVKP